MKISIIDENGIEKNLGRLSQFSAEKIIKKSAKQIFNRGKTIGGTPRGKTRGKIKGGKLVQSLTWDGYATVGYTMDYAPHVEYGHRLCRPRGHQIGYVQGQYYLRKNVDKQKSIFIQDLKDAIAKE